MATVSIITPTYNSEKYVIETIKSVLNQTYTDFELIIVDDCSSDNTVSIIKSFADKDKRIILRELINNIGAAEARNIALREASGRYIAFLDSDDVWLNNKLELQLDFMVAKRIAFSFTSYHVMNERGEILNTINVPDRICYTNYLKNTIIGCLTVVIDKKQIRYFEMPNIRSSHDMALWLLILKRGYIAHGLNVPLAKYRLVSTSNTSKKVNAALDVWKVYREIEKLGLIYSSYCFCCYVLNAIIKRLKYV